MAYKLLKTFTSKQVTTNLSDLTKGIPAVTVRHKMGSIGNLGDLSEIEKTFSKLPQWLNLEQSDHMDKPIEATVTGEIPSWVSGSLYRNGSGLYKIGATAWRHVFDGFAVIQRWTITKGKVTYQSSILDTEDYKKCASLNRVVGAGLGNNFPDPCKTIFGRLMSSFVPDGPEKVDNTAVSLIEFGDRLFALTETPAINEISPETLAVKEKSIMSNILSVHMGTAHPHMLEDGTMVYFGTNMNYTKAYNFITIPPPTTESEAPFSGARVVASIPSRWKMHISYTHSFGLTPNYFIHLEQPLAINIPRLASMALRGLCMVDCFTSYENETMNFLVIDRHTGKQTNLTYRAPSGFVFHFVNCYEESDHLVCDVCYYPGGSASILAFYIDALAEDKEKKEESSSARAQYARFVLPLNVEKAEEDKNLVTLPGTTATAVLEKGSKTVLCITPDMIKDSPTSELPRINYAYNGKKYRYYYSTTDIMERKQQVCKFDVVNQTHQSFCPGEGYRPGEPVFLARPGTSEEDDGVVLCTIVAETSDVESYLVVLDGKTFKEVARASVPKDVKMSLTFHGVFTDKVVAS